MKKFQPKRYIVQAKRKNSNEKWSEWTNINNYREAVRHARHVDELGFDAKIVVKDKAVEELWAILGGSNQAVEQTDAILNAGFRKWSEVMREIMSDVDELICDHATGDICDKELYLRFKKLKKKYNYSEENNG